MLGASAERADVTNSGGTDGRLAPIYQQQRRRAGSRQGGWEACDMQIQLTAK